MSEPKTIKVGVSDVKLDASNMSFNEATLGKYLESEAMHYNYFGEKLAEAEYIQHRAEMEYDSIYAEKFKTYKEEGGCSDKLSEASAKADSEVQDAKKKALQARYNVKLLYQHLRAWDKNHENAQSRGYMLRKEIDKLGNTVRRDLSLEDKVNEIVGASNVDDETDS